MCFNAALPDSMLGSMIAQQQPPATSRAVGHVEATSLT